MIPGRNNAMTRRRGFTMLEVTLVSGMMAFLVVLLSSAWIAMGRPTAALIARSQLYQEMDMAVAALAHDLGGGLANPEGRLAGKKLNRWVGWMAPSGNELWLCFDGGPTPNSTADWGLPDTVVVYRIESHTLVRWDQAAGTTFPVAGNVESLTITPQAGNAIRIDLTFEYRQLTRTCTLVARMP